MKNKGFGSLCGIFAICMTSFILFAGIAAGETSKTYDISFNYDEFGHYRTISLAGDDYLVSYDTKYDDIYDGIINDVEIGKDIYNMNLLEHGMVSKILIDSKEKYTVSADDGLELKEGYVIWIKTVEPEKSRLVIELAKDKTIVDKKVVIPGTSDDVYVYDKVDFGADKNIPTIIVRVDDIFTHTYTHDAVVTIEGLFQTSDTRAIVKFDEVKKTYVLVDDMSSIDIFLNKLVDGMSSIYLFLNELFDKISSSPHYAIFFVVLFYPFIHWI
ncbi:MAG: hypothetical protein KAH86_07710, partial [Methanosarcinales archaeon]|nr:hypothetical protein [Methanosarcinales archaeon]